MTLRVLGPLGRRQVRTSHLGAAALDISGRKQVRSHPLTRDIAESSIDVVVVAGYAAYRLLAQRPVISLMPDSNAYHIACAEASLRWLQRRAAWRTDC